MAGVAKYQPYPTYQSSYADWSGNVPEHWVPIRLKYVFSEKKKRLNPSLPAGSISFGNVIFKNEDSLAKETKAAYQEVLAGEFLVNPLNMNFDLISLRTALSSIDAVVSTGYLVLQSHEGYNKNFLRWLLQQFDVAHMKTLGAGVRQTISFTDIGNSFIFEPPLPEQTKIAAFLDYEIAKIDTLIAKQQQLIALLQEKRLAVISHAVTKGLDPTAPLRPSGVDWLGDVPAHWDICIAKFKYQTTTDGAHISPDLIDGKHYFVSVKDVRNREINFDEALLTSTKNFDYLVKNGCKPQKGDVLYSKDGTIGETVVCPDTPDFVVASSLIIIRPDQEQLNSHFYEFVLRSSVISEQVGSYVKGAALPRLSIQNFLKNFGVFPPLREQEDIAEYLEVQSKKFDRLTSQAQSGIALLKERRTALISAAVTGKIDVRDWQKPEGAADTSNQDTRFPDIDQNEEALA